MNKHDFKLKNKHFSKNIDNIFRSILKERN
jgi:hypothetical protein